MEDLVSLTQKLNSIGIRSELYWAIADVNTVSYNGELYDLKDAKKQGIVHKEKDNNPQIGVRLLRTNHRIEDYFKNNNAQEKRGMLLSVYDAFNKETKLSGRDMPILDIENREHQKLYFETVLKQHIENLALLINYGLTYYHMHSSNLTLMGEIVDTAVIESIHINDTEPFQNLEGVYDTSSRTDMYKGVRIGYLKDMRDCITGIRFLLRGLHNDGYNVSKREEAYDLVVETFERIFDKEKFAVVDTETNVQKIGDALKEIAKRILVERETLPPLKRNGIETWHLGSL